MGEYLGQGQWRRYTTALVAFQPFSYRPLSGVLHFHPTLVVTIEYRLHELDSPARREIEQLRDDHVLDDVVARHLVNVDQVQAWYDFNKERAVNIVLVLLMLVTGGFTFYEAVRRFFVPFEPEVDWFTFLATFLSALVCLALHAYQRYVGLRSGSMALITQSVDSRNHVIVAASVTAGLVASLLQFPLLDTLVGLTVALLILKSAVELAIETVRSLGAEEMYLSRYKMGLAEWHQRFRQAQLRDWMLSVVQNQMTQTRSEPIAQSHQPVDFSSNPMLRELGLAQQPHVAEIIEQSLTELFERGWLVGDERLSVTDVGREHLRRQMQGTLGEIHLLHRE